MAIPALFLGKRFGFVLKGALRGIKTEVAPSIGESLPILY
jgi:hypothetical protein